MAAFHFEHLVQLELRQARMRQVERNGDPRHAVRCKPFVRQPVERPEHQAARVQFRVELCDPRLDVGAFDRESEVAHPDLEQLLVAERRPSRLSHGVRPRLT
jgi:hypothetical protein